MNGFSFTPYFENEVLRKRPYLKKEWCTGVVQRPLKVAQQDNDRFRFWGRIEEAGGKFLRVVTLGDKVTIHNAFFDRDFTI